MLLCWLNPRPIFDMLFHKEPPGPRPLRTYADFPAFWTPSPPCSHFGLNRKTKFTQPPLLRTLLGHLPPGPPPWRVRT